MTARHAIYFAPPTDAPLWRLASAVIGRDAATDEPLAFPAAAPCDAPDWAELTAEPRRYGFHATLKAPFELALGTDEAALLDAARGFASGRTGFELPAPEVALLGSFVAVRPGRPSPELERLAADAVVLFEPYRAPLSEGDLSRRLAVPLTDRQIEAVERWGYPYVFEDFRFHMTLTGSLPEPRREPVRAALAALLAEVTAPITVDAIAVFRQERRDAPFVLVERIPFSGRSGQAR
jgi:putative phosphonate metabolism protein